MNNLMLDVETLGVSTEAPLISIGAVFFDPLTGECGDEFYKVITLSSALENSLVDPRTLQWWMKQSDTARAVFNDPSAVDLCEALQEFSLFVEVCDNDKVQVWGNGASFDNAILAAVYRKHAQKIPWQFRNDRDVRTIVELAKCLKGFDAKANFSIDAIEAHHALRDAKFQVAYVSAAFRALAGES
ncbi:3'-5' exonuclease [Proteus mirabilis]|uniref:3'-5' exonuclease n=1 Tax=Proteus mirabilis TaxID=584 RepID=UPI0021C19152|nr:3'-5' exonuclease [Proteus mirabilis]MCT9019357.1 3'-5' exoribonuclease [Proteus mirabilis]